jgi:hypothetical protein
MTPPSCGGPVRDSKTPVLFMGGRALFTRGATSVRPAEKKNPIVMRRDVSDQPHSVRVRHCDAIPFAQVTVAVPAGTTRRLTFRSAAPGAIRRLRSGRFSPSPALCAAASTRTLPHQSLWPYKISEEYRERDRFCQGQRGSVIRHSVTRALFYKGYILWWHQFGSAHHLPSEAIRNSGRHHAIDA